MTSTDSTRNLLFDARWLLLSIVVPVVILVLLGFNITSIIWPSLASENQFYWLLLLGVYGALAMAIISRSYWQYARQVSLKKAETIAWFLIVVAIAYLTFQLDRKLLPFSIPRYLVNRDDFGIYVLTAFAPGVFHLLVTLIGHYTPAQRHFKAYKSFLAAVSVPLVAYIYFMVLLPLFKIPGGMWFQHSQAVIAISMVVVFLFFFIRSVFIIVARQRKTNPGLVQAARVLFCLVFPLLGLYFNDHPLTGFARHNQGGIFGDFSHPAYYILAVVTGLLILVPAPGNPKYRLALFLARVATLPYTLFFFFIFLPYLPFSLVALFIYGMGILMIAPSLLFYFHCRLLWSDYLALRSQMNRRHLYASIIALFGLVPLGVLANFYSDKLTLQAALDYTYQPDFTKGQTIDFSLDRLDRVLKTVEKQKDRRQTRTPIITPLYKKVVLDNLTLSQARINDLRQLYFDMKPQPVRRARFAFEPAQLGEIKLKTSNANGFYQTRVDLEVFNPGKRQGEYVTRIQIPPAVFITDYYLRIAGKNEPGILTEKKAALWIYQQITSRRRDPGLLTYLDNRHLQLRVFPVEAGQKRFTGFTIKHQSKITFKVGSRTLVAGGENQGPALVEAGKGVYLSQAFKQGLPLLKRKPYLHFVLDVSRQSNLSREILDAEIRRAAAPFKDIELASAQVSLVNYEIETLPYQALINQGDIKLKKQGGLALNRALGYHLSKLVMTEKNNHVPVFIVLSPRETLPCDRELSYLEHYYGDVTSLYRWQKGQLWARPFFATGQCQFKPAATWSGVKAVRKYNYNDRSFFLADNPGAAIVSAPSEHGQDKISALVNSQSLWQQKQLNPVQTEVLRFEILKNNFDNRVLSPLSAFIVVETESQRRRLLKAQAEILNAKDYFDYGEERRMSEPSLSILALIIALGVLVRWFIRQKYSAARKRVEPC